MECTSKRLDNGFLDGPEQGCRLLQLSVRQTQGMFKLFRMEDPVKGVFSPEFIAPCHINTDIGIISGESGPDFFSTFAEGNGRTKIFSHQEMGPAKRAACHPDWGSGSAERLAAMPDRTFHRHKVIPQGGDEEVLAGFGVTCATCESLSPLP
jgi:hypothetical protein